MRTSFLLVAALGGLLVSPVAAQSQTAPSSPKIKPAQPEPAEPAGEPDHIKVQHILISFKGKLPGKPITRTREEAKKLAYELLERAKGGADFDALVKEYTDDAHPGIYGMANNGVQAASGEFPRGRMVAAFGDTGFPLPAGGIGIADYDARKSPYGWHIVKRLE